MFNDHTDAEYDRRETAYEMGGDTAEETRYYAWLRKVEKLLKLDSLDGDSTTDGYSLDEASDMFDKGISPDDAANTFAERMHDL